MLENHKKICFHLRIKNLFLQMSIIADSRMFCALVIQHHYMTASVGDTADERLLINGILSQIADLSAFHLLSKDSGSKDIFKNGSGSNDILNNFECAQY